MQMSNFLMEELQLSSHVLLYIFLFLGLLLQSHTHLSDSGLVFFVLFGFTARFALGFGPDVTNSIGNKGTAHVPFWILKKRN